MDLATLYWLKEHEKCIALDMVLIEGRQLECHAHRREIHFCELGNLREEFDDE